MFNVSWSFFNTTQSPSFIPFFFASSSLTEKSKQNIKDYIATKKTFFSSGDSLEKYHQLQEQVFESAINQSLQKFGEKDAKLTWLIDDESAHPILSLYKNRFDANKSNEKVQKLAQHIPTFVVGLEATLNYAVFSCTYTVDSSDIIKNTTNLISAYKVEDLTLKEYAESLLDAKRILDYTLQSYDSLIIAYPQHQAYEKLIDELQILKKQFKTFEAINSKCVYPNHFNSSCKK